MAEVTIALETFVPARLHGKIRFVIVEVAEGLEKVEVVRLTHIIVSWRSGAVPWMVATTFEKEDQRVCSNYRGIAFLCLPGKVYENLCHGSE